MKRALQIAGGGAIAMTLMACYGIAPRPAMPPDGEGNGPCPAADDHDGDGHCGDDDCNDDDPTIFAGCDEPSPVEESGEEDQILAPR
ncbi:MAG: hypothetical protein KC731_24735 [Myxococcales bacterium]|nr:hypothetical protein [Myxococcales bacterium]